MHLPFVSGQDLDSVDCKYIPSLRPHGIVCGILIDRRWHSSIIDVRSFRGTDCDTDHYLVVAKVRERLAVRKQVAQKSDGENLI